MVMSQRCVAQALEMSAARSCGVRVASEEVTTNTHKPTLQIQPHMSLEEAMAEVRSYLDATGASPRRASVPRELAAAPGQPRPFALLGSSIARLSQVAAKCGEIEPDGKGGAFGSYLKRIIRKAIGWYSRPVYEFDRNVIEAFEQTRLDMLGLQQQINGLTANSTQPAEHAELLRSIVELLFANVATVQALRGAIQDERPEFRLRFEELLKTSEAELADIKTALLEQLSPGPDN
jgi:hypothetical protein